MNQKEIPALDQIMSRLMLWSVLLASGIMLCGGIYFLWSHGEDPTRDHLFTGEPQDLKDPILMVKAAMEGNKLSLIQIGVFLLLLNPLLRVLLAFFGFSIQKNWLYVIVSMILLGVLSYSLFLA